MKSFLITLAIVFSQHYILGQSQSEILKFNAVEESIKIFDNTKNEWKDWSAWEAKQFKVELSDKKLSLNNSVGNFQILKLRELTRDKDGDEIREYSAVDKEMERCDVTLLKFNSKPGKYQLYIRYGMINIAYNLQIEE